MYLSHITNFYRIFLRRYFVSSYRKYSGMEDTIELGKKVAARAAVDENVTSHQKIGIGSGTTIVYAVERIAEKVKSGELNDIICVATSYQARQAILSNGLHLGDLAHYPVLDIDIDGADEVDAELTLNKGAAGCLMREKIIASCARKFYVIADFRKDVDVLGTTWLNGIPIEVARMATIPVAQKVVKRFGGTCTLRLEQNKVGACVTDNGNFILDWKFDKLHDWAKIDQQLQYIPGVLDTGLFVGMADKVYFGQADGSVTTR